MFQRFLDLSFSVMDSSMIHTSKIYLGYFRICHNYYNIFYPVLVLYFPSNIFECKCPTPVSVTCSRVSACISNTVGCCINQLITSAHCLSDFLFQHVSIWTQLNVSLVTFYRVSSLAHINLCPINHPCFHFMKCLVDASAAGLV